MYLPFSGDLPVNFLSGSLDDTATSYKFYWLLSILEVLKNNFSDISITSIDSENYTNYPDMTNNRVIAVEELICRMLANAWFPVNYFRLSFGTQDKISRAILEIRNVLNIPVDSSKEIVFKEIKKLIKVNNSIKKLVKDLARFVPYRLLRPWFKNELARKPDTEINDLIVSYSVRDFNSNDNAPLYRIIKTPELCIEINQEWLQYLQKNIQILTGFVYWNLTNYLQKRNPNVPNIPGKLVEKSNRDLKQAKEFWHIVLKDDEINCIYSGLNINENISIDHFIPWSFVTHDLLWNLTPTTRSVNSSKSDKLPDFKKYFLPFAKLQYKAFKVVYNKDKKKLLEDYAILYNSDLDTIYSSTFENFKNKLDTNLAPLYQIAVNMGFQKGWKLN